jgi:hypothetical protein
MIKKIFAFTLILSSTPTLLCALDEDRITLTWYWNSEIGSHLDHLADTMKLYNNIQIKGSYEYSRHLSLFFNLKKFYDAVYDVSGRYDRGSHRTAKNTGNTWLREIFLDIDYQRLFMRAGRQQVVWGSADGIRALDCINPGDGRYAYLDDASEYRIPLWMMRLEARLSVDTTLQFLLIPDFEPAFSTSTGDVYVYRSTDLSAKRLQSIPSFIPITKHKRTPPDNLTHSTYAIRWQQVVRGWEYTLNYKYGFESYPRGEGKFLLKDGWQPRFTLTLDYRTRIHLIGGSFSKAVNEGPLRGLTVRGELVYTLGKPFPYGDHGEVAGNTTMNTFTYIVGLDKIFFTDVLASAQFIQFVYPRTRSRDTDVFFPATFAPLHRVETIVTLRVSTHFMAERLKPEFLMIYDGRNDWRISPKVHYEINDHLWVYAGVHFFAGKANSLFGQFRNDSMLYVGQLISF